MSATFNVTDLSPYEFDAEISDSRMNPFEEGGNDSTQEVDYKRSKEVRNESSRELEVDKSSARPGVMTKSRARKLKEEMSRMIEQVKTRQASEVESSKVSDTVLLLQVDSTLSTSQEIISTTPHETFRLPPYY